MKHLNRLLSAVRTLFFDATRTCFELFKAMVPVIIVVKLLMELDLIRHLAWPLEPVMRLLGLPAEMGLVWASSILVNIYAGMLVYAELWPNMDPLTTAQVTVLSVIMLVAHNLPVELRITQKCGASLRGQFALRMGAAVLFGLILHLVFSQLGILQEPARLLWTPPPQEPGWTAWALNQLDNLAMIFLIICALMTLMRILDGVGLTKLLIKALEPLLRIMGVGREAATITIIGLSMGIAYGGGLLLHEARKGTIKQRDLTASLSLMSLSHALIEDTLLMMMLGASLIGTLWGRLLLSLALVSLLTRIWAWREAKTNAQGTSSP